MHLLKPRLSEKAFALSQTTNTFAIDVPTDINKYEVADAVEKQFDVKVKSVRLVNRKGKVKRVMNTTGKRSASHKGTQADIKKAYVTLAPGSHLPFFQAEEAEVAEVAKEAEKAKQPENTEKKSAGLKKLVKKSDDKKAEKPAKKETK
jgi:large subunit ribosomal protein L23